MPDLRIVTMLLAAGTAAADARAAKPTAGADPCLISLSRVRNAPRFESFPAPAPRRARPAALRLDTPEARRYRTVLRAGLRTGANFAGRFSIVAWGCGASCTDFAVVDTATGRSAFPQRYRAISGVHVADTPPAALGGLNSLRFRRDSRLLVVLGAPREDERREGATYLAWTGRGFRPVRFIPAGRLCLPPARTPAPATSPPLASPARPRR